MGNAKKVDDTKLNIGLNVVLPSMAIKQFAYDIGANNDQDGVFELIKQLELSQQDSGFLERVYLHFKSAMDEESKLEAEWNEKQQKNK